MRFYFNFLQRFTADLTGQRFCHGQTQHSQHERTTQTQCFQVTQHFVFIFVLFVSLFIFMRQICNEKKVFHNKKNCLEIILRRNFLKYHSWYFLLKEFQKKYYVGWELDRFSERRNKRSWFFFSDLRKRVVYEYSEYSLYEYSPVLLYI